MPERIDELFNAMREYDLPAGIYTIRHDEGGDEIIDRVNLEFLRIFDYDDFEEIEGTKVLDRYESERKHEELMTALDWAATQDGILHSHHHKIKTKHGTPIPVEVHTRTDYDKDGEIIGRTGIIVPISDIEMLLENFGMVLHRYSHTLAHLRLQLDAIAGVLHEGNDPFGKALTIPSYEDIEAKLKEPLKHLENALAGFVEDGEEGKHGHQALAYNDWEELSLRLQLIQHLEETVMEQEHRPATIMQATQDIVRICKDVKKGFINKEKVKDVISKARAVMELTALFDIRLSTGQILEMEHEVLTARELTLYNTGHKNEPETVEVGEMINEAKLSLEQFAQSRRIEVGVEGNPRFLEIQGVYRDLMRTVQNLLHNAIKYSWSKPYDPVWISVNYGIDKSGKMVKIAVENYGVPIMPDEIEKVLELGYRGRMSGDRSRRGTGIGLYDAMRVIRMHRGRLEVVSMPASGDDYNDKNKPFITTVTLYIPLIS